MPVKTLRMERACLVFLVIYQRLAFVAEETNGLSSNFTQSDEMVTRSMKEETVLFASFIKWISATPFFQDKCLLSAERNNSLLFTGNSKRFQKAKFALLG